MRVALVVACLVGGACYSPQFPTGAPCASSAECPGTLVCAKTGTCQQADSLESELDAAIPDVDACVATSEICDDGIDQDCNGADLSCALNDLLGQAVNVTNGGSFNADLTLANDNYVQSGCGGAGGRDVFYEVNITAPQVYYFDTFTSDFDSVLRVFPGIACTALTQAATPTCNDNACNTGNSQLALTLPSGRSCIVVDANAAATTGSLALRVTRGGRTGAPLAGGAKLLTGDTCTETHQSNPTIECGDSDNDAKDIGWWFTACPGQTRMLDASTCEDVTMVHFDTVLYVHKAGVQADLVCRDDTSTCAFRPDRADMHPDGTVLTDIAMTGPGLFWLVLDAYDMAACGGYRLDTNLD